MPGNTITNVMGSPTLQKPGSQLIMLLLAGLSLLTALSPGFGVGSLVLNFPETPILLAWLLMRWQRSLMLTLLSATAALIIWGLQSPVLWLAIYLNSTMLILMIVLVRRLFTLRDLSVLGLSYWFFIGTPLTFLIFALSSGDTLEAGIAASIRIAAGILSLALATMIYIFIIAARPYLSPRFFPNPARLVISLDGLGRLMGSFLIPIPMVIFTLAAASTIVGDRLEAAASLASHELDQAWHLYHELRHQHRGSGEAEPADSAHPASASTTPATPRPDDKFIETINLAANAHSQSNRNNSALMPIYIDLIPDCAAQPAQNSTGIPTDAYIVLTEGPMTVWIPGASAPDGQVSANPVMRGRLELVTIRHQSEISAMHFEEGQCLRASYKVWDALKGTLSNMMWWVWAATGFLLIIELFIWWFVQLFSTPLKEVAQAMGDFSARQLAGASGRFEFKSASRLHEVDTLMSGFKDMETHIGSFASNLRTLNSNYESLLDQTAVGFAAIDQFGNTAYRNDSMKILLERARDLIDQVEQLHAGSAFEIRPLSIKLARGQLDLLTGVIDRFDADGQVDGFWVVATDVTALRSTEAQLIQSQKMATLGEMATGVAHEINQPLQAIRLTLANMARQLEKEPPDLERVKGKIESTVEQVYRVAELVKHMKSFGRTAGTDQAPFLPDATIQTLADAWRENYSSAGVSLSLDLQAGESARILGNRNQFEQVIINLLQNARDAAEQHRRETHVTLSSRGTASYYQLKVTDRSGGIPDDVIDNIFTPFFTTKDPDKGTGIGLSISYTIIRDMSGTVSVANVGEGDERGARFTVTMPLTSEQPNILE